MDAMGTGRAAACRPDGAGPVRMYKPRRPWTLWLEETLLAAVPHRQVVLTIPKRLRTWCLYRRALLGDLARVAAKTVTAAVRTLTCEPDVPRLRWS